MRTGAAPPTVALDVQACLGYRRSGVGWYGTHLVRSLLGKPGPERYLLVANSYRARPSFPFSHPRASEVVLRWPTLPPSWPRALQLRAFAYRYRRLLPRALRASSAAVVHGINFFVPPRGPYARVATVHDADFLTEPGRQSPVNQVLFRNLVTPELPSLDAAIVPSRAVRDRLLSRVALPPGRVHVVPEAPAPEFLEPVAAERLRRFRAAFGLPERFALCVGTLEPRKNLVTAVRALAICRRPPDLRLVLVGQPGWGGLDLLGEAARLGVRHRVRAVGYVAPADLPLFYRAASVFLMPSLDEGFGLPLVEAMASGTPAICSDRGSLPEVAGGAALVLPPDDPRAWAEAIERVLSRGAVRRRLSAAGRRRARRFSWQSAAQATLSVYRAVAEEATSRA